MSRTKLRHPVKTDRRRSKTHGTYTGDLKGKIAVQINAKTTVFVNNKSEIAAVRKKYELLNAASNKDLATFSHFNKPILSASQKKRQKEKQAEKTQRRKEFY